MKDLKESVYHSAVISALAVGYTMLGKTLIKMSPTGSNYLFSSLSKESINKE